MSGAKDYAYDFEAERRRALKARLRQLQREHEAAVQARLRQLQREQEEATRAKIEQFQRERAAAAEIRLADARAQSQRAVSQELGLLSRGTSESLERARSSNASRLTAQEKAAEEHRLTATVRQTSAEFSSVAQAIQYEVSRMAGIADENAQPLVSRLAALQSELPNAETITRAQQLLEDAQLARETCDAQLVELREQLGAVSAWQEALRQDDVVQQFHGGAAKKWEQKTNELVTEAAAQLPLGEALRQTKTACEQAQCLHEEAGLRKAQFEVRNEFLRDMIDSLHAVGFFVGDPFYEIPDDPGGPVVVRAQRAGEEVVTRIDLSQEVRSMWNGIAGEHCKDGFLAFLQEMKQRGVDIEPQRADLKPPLRIEKGAIDLPSQRSRQAGK